MKFQEWVAERRREAIVRGGKPLRNLPGAQDYEVPFTFPTARKRGEIVNPITGEIVTGCVVIAKLAAELDVTTHELTDRLESMGFIQRSLRTKEVPMIVQPSLTKPRYYLTPEATRRAVEDGFLIPILVRVKGIPVDCILITPDGQKRCREVEGRTSKQLSKIDQRKLQIAQLLAAGCSQTQISNQTNIPKQTVSRIVRSIKEPA